MQSAYKQLQEFVEAASIKRTGRPKKPFSEQTTPERIKTVDLQTALIVEESTEVHNALDDVLKDQLGRKVRKDNLAHLTKELCDLIYVCTHAAVELGLDLPKAFDKVHANNLLKINTSTVREDGKLVKPIDHPQVDLGDCI